MNMTQELKEALKRAPAPSGFTERAIAKVKLRSRRRSWHLGGLSRVAAIFMILTVVGLAGYQYFEEQRVRRGEQARAQLMMALQITAEKTDIARRALQN